MTDTDVVHSPEEERERESDAHDPHLVDLFRTERPCDGNFDKSQLALRSVDNSTRQYNHKMILLKDADITRVVRAEAGDPDYSYSGVSRHYFFALELAYRQDWTPSGYGLGELISSISLLPNEETIMEVKTWETSKTQQDETKDLESKNISDVKVDKSDIKEVLDDVQEKTHHQVDVKASASWGWGSASASYGFSNDVAEQHKTVTKQSKAIAEKSVNSIRQKRTVKMAMSRETGSEEKTTRKLKNINQCRTLNVSFYQVLRAYDIQMSLDSVNLLLYGPWVYKSVWDLYVKAGWDIEAIMMDALKDDALDSDGDYFLQKVGPHVVPRPDAVRITGTSTSSEQRVTYAYEVIPGFDKGKPKGMAQLLTYLFSYLSTSSPPEHMGPIEIMKQSEIGVAARPLDRPEVGAMFVARTHFLSDIELVAFPSTIQTVIDRITNDYADLQDDVGKVMQSWESTIPTQGIHAETTLGMCSGCEDYFTVQRQFDLELKRLQVAKAEAEIVRAHLVNAQLESGSGASAVVLKNPTDQTTLSVDVDIDASDGTTVVEVQDDDDGDS